MNEPNLKPCPFCGGEAIVKDGMIYVDKGVLVKCSRCFVKTNIVLIDHPRLKYDGLDESTRYTRDQAIQKAVEVWNRRVNDE